ncbi:MAG: 4Fe-4S binding protein [Lentisphaeria bacterium]|nr:4Fe-4S binding protein [Lentisphaeria bacterium]
MTAKACPLPDVSSGCDLARRTGPARTVIILIPGLMSAAAAESRFPRPDFVSGHVSPETIAPAVESGWLGWLDTGLLLVALALAAALVLRWRSRAGLVALTVASVSYFGFFRHGCVCPVGAIQNVALSVTDPDWLIPAGVIVIFLAPLVFSLFFGRVFCAAVCPLGAMQELVVIRHLNLPPWVNKVGSVTRHLFLGFVVFAAVTGTGFFICRLDPFVPLFRFGGHVPALLTALAVLAVATVIGRPYCRFLCPYSVLLEWGGRLSWKQAAITPGTCVNCRLCEHACPYGAIEKPELTARQTARGVAGDHRALVMTLVSLPLLAIGGWAGGGVAATWIGHRHPDVHIAELLTRTDTISASDRERLEAFDMSGQSRENAVTTARKIYSRYQSGGRWLGAYAGVVLAFHLIRLSRRHYHTDYRPDPAACLGCGRCFRYCPVPVPPTRFVSRERSRECMPGTKKSPFPRNSRGRADGISPD